MIKCGEGMEWTRAYIWSFLFLYFQALTWHQLIHKLASWFLYHERLFFSSSHVTLWDESTEGLRNWSPDRFLKPLHMERCLGMLELKPTKHFLDTWGFVWMRWKMVISHEHSQSFSWDAQRGLIVLSPSSLYSLRKNSGDRFRRTSCANPLGSWRGAARRAEAVNAQALNRQGDVVITASPTC